MIRTWAATNQTGSAVVSYTSSAQLQLQQQYQQQQYRQQMEQ
jgi:hypothetical protein